MRELRSWGETAGAAAQRAAEVATEVDGLLETLGEGEEQRRKARWCARIATSLRAAGASVAAEAKQAGEAAMESSARATALAEGAKKAAEAGLGAGEAEDLASSPEEHAGALASELLGEAAMRCALYGCGAVNAAEAVVRMEAQVKETLQTVAQVDAEEAAVPGQEGAEVFALGQQLLASALRRFAETVRHAAEVAQEAAAAAVAAVEASPEAAAFAVRAEAALGAAGRRRGRWGFRGDTAATPNAEGAGEGGRVGEEEPGGGGYPDGKAAGGTGGVAAGTTPGACGGRGAPQTGDRAREEEAAAARAAKEAEEKARTEWVRKLLQAQRELRELHTGLGATQARLRAAYAANPLLLPPNLVTRGNRRLPAKW